MGSDAIKWYWFRRIIENSSIFSLLTIHFFIHSKSNNQSNYDEKILFIGAGRSTGAVKCLLEHANQ